MPYIGNDIRANVDYKTIDDISGSFNGSTTSFALQVGGVAPTPFPKYETQLIISVGGVIQEPDSSGSAGFQLSGTNIVFSSAPATGEAFFGVLLASADYLNAGGTFPDGTVVVPSITFTEDTDTGFTRISSGAVAVTSNGTKIAQFPTSQGSSGQALTTDGAGVLSFSTINTDVVDDSSPQLGGDLDVNTKNILFGDSSSSADDRIKFGASTDLQIFHDGNSKIQNSNNGCDLRIISDTVELKGNSADEMMLKSVVNNQVELYHNNVKKLETSSAGAIVTGELTTTSVGGTAGKGAVAFGSSGAPFIEGLDSGNHGSGSQIKIADGSGENHIICKKDNAVEVYFDNSKKLETTSGGINVTGAITVNGSALSSGKVLQVQYDEKTDKFASTSSSFVTVTGLSVTITPASSSNKILVRAVVSCGMGGGGIDGFIRLIRDTGPVVTLTNEQCIRQSGSQENFTWVLEELDSPNTTSTLTYKIQGKTGSNEFFINRDGGNQLLGQCSITAIEID